MRIGSSNTAIGCAAPGGQASGGMPDRVLMPIFVALWTSGYVVGAVALGVADPLPVLAVRFALASLAAVPMAMRGGRWRGAPLGRLAVVGLFLQVLQFGGAYGGLALGVPAALVALVMLGLSPLVTTGLAVATGQERADARLWIGLAVGVAGVAISLAPELGSARAGVGVLVTLMAALGLSGGTVLQKRWALAADPIVSVAVQSVTAAALLAPAVAVFGGRFDLSLRLVLSMAWIAWGMGLLSLGVFVRILRRHAASTAAALLLLVPPVTAVASVPALGEALHPASLAGMLVALAGVWVVLRRAAPARAAERQAVTASSAACRAPATSASSLP
jgi:drug/metabolite transporter (DMT)-like permease